MTNAKFAAQDPTFRKACELTIIGRKRIDETWQDVSLPPTKRQASKWRLGRGLAFQKKGEAVQALKEENKTL